MFEWKVKDIKATNAIFLAETGDDEGRPFKSRFLQAGLVKYDFGVCLLKKETIDKFVNTFINQPVIIGHKDDIKKDDVVGYVHNIWFSPEDGWFWCDGKLTDKEAIKKVEKGFNVSCQYRITEYSNNTEKKLHNGNPYDKEILSGIFEHLAIVENPRYEDAFIAVNAYIAENEDRWITIHPNGEENKGRHLLIKDGESVEDAMHRNGWYKKRQAKETQKKEDTNIKETQSAKLSDMLAPKQKKEQRPIKLNYIKQTRDGYALYENPKTKTMYMEKDGQFYDMKYREVNKDFDFDDNKQSDTAGEGKESNKINEIAEDYKDYFDENQLKEFKKELARFNKYKGLNKADLKESKESFKNMKPEEALERLKRSNDWVEKNNKEEKLKKRFYDYVEKNDFKDSRVLELASFIGSFEGLGIEKPITLKEMQDDPRYNFRTELALKYLADKSGFDNYFKDKEEDRVKAGYDKFIEIVYGKSKASNAFVEQFKDMLYETIAEGIVKRLGEYIAQNEERWITIHPHGEDSEDYRRLKLKDNETPKEAIDRVYKKEDKKEDKNEKTKEELKAEQRQLYADILKAKKEKRHEDQIRMFNRYKEITSILKGEKQTKKEEESKHFKEFNKVSEEAEKLRKTWTDLAEKSKNEIENNPEYKKLEKKETELTDERSKLNYSTEKARWHQISQEINEIYGLKENIRKDISNKLGLKNAQEAYYAKSLEVDKIKTNIINNSSDAIAKQLKENSKTDNILKEFKKLGNEQYLVYKNQEIKYKKQYDDLLKEPLKGVYGTEEYNLQMEQRSEVQSKYYKARTEARKIHYDFALKIGKILQVQNGVKLNTEVSNSKMNDIEDKLHKCFDGVVPSNVFNATKMKISPNGGRAYQQGQSIHISPTERMGTAIHETVHHIEENSPQVLINSLTFAKYRTGDEKQRSLKKLTGDSYKANEVCKPDKFFHPYCGKLYNFAGGKNQSFDKGTASEIMSMGVQRVFEDPINFANEDREYFNFVLMNLRGELWD